MYLPHKKPDGISRSCFPTFHFARNRASSSRDTLTCNRVLLRKLASKDRLERVECWCLVHRMLTKYLATFYNYYFISPLRRFVSSKIRWDRRLIYFIGSVDNRTIEGPKRLEEGYQRCKIRETVGKNCRSWNVIGDPSYPLKLLVNMLCILLRVDCHCRIN